MRLPVEIDKREALLERLWAKVATPRLLGECWLWTGALTPKGYGQIGVCGKVCRATRVLWALTRGPIPEGKMVCHSCDHPSCMNPDHHWLGTALDNARDMIAKGRQNYSTDGRTYPNRRKPTRPSGYVHNRAKLTPAEAVEIRAALRSGHRPADLAQRFGVSRQNIYNVAKAKTWAAAESVA